MEDSKVNLEKRKVLQQDTDDACKPSSPKRSKSDGCLDDGTEIPARPEDEPLATSAVSQQQESHGHTRQNLTLRVANGCTPVVSNGATNQSSSVRNLGPEHGVCARALFDYSSDADDDINLNVDDVIINIETVDEDWSIGTAPDGRSGLFPSNYVEYIKKSKTDGCLRPEVPAGPEDEPVATSAMSPSAWNLGPEHGVCARARYDYSADDDDDINLNEGDVITNIETVDEGWAIGTAPDGRSGLFPRNYVDFIKQ